MQGLPGGERELDNACTALKVFGEAGIPLARQRFAGDASPGLTSPYRSVHRGGYTSRGEYRHHAKPEQRSLKLIQPVMAS